jgi:hypothetical protein
VVRELALRLCKYVAHVLLVHHRDGNDLVVRHHDVRAGRELELRRCTGAVRELVLRRCTCAVREPGLRLYMNVMREPALRLCKYVAHVLLVHHHDENDLVVRHHDVREERGLELRRCTCEVRERDDRLRSDRGFRLAFRHPCAVVYLKDSKRHYSAWLHELRRAGIQRGCVHLGREAHEVREIQPLPPWNLAWHASWQQLFLRQHGEPIQLLAWIRYRGRGLVLAFGRAAFS